MNKTLTFTLGLVHTCTRYFTKILRSFFASLIPPAMDFFFRYFLLANRFTVDPIEPSRFLRKITT